MNSRNFKWTHQEAKFIGLTFIKWMEREQIQRKPLKNVSQKRKKGRKTYLFWWSLICGGILKFMFPLKTNISINQRKFQHLQILCFCFFWKILDYASANKWTKYAVNFRQKYADRVEEIYTGLTDPLLIVAQFYNPRRRPFSSRLPLSLCSQLVFIIFIPITALCPNLTWLLCNTHTHAHAQHPLTFTWRQCQLRVTASDDEHKVRRQTSASTAASRTLFFLRLIERKKKEKNSVRDRSPSTHPYRHAPRTQVAACTWHEATMETVSNNQKIVRFWATGRWKEPAADG